MPHTPPRVIRTPGDAASLGTVLGVWAHPDDETFLSSGVMTLARRAGNRVVCVTATRGEHGTDDPERWPPDRVARTRDLEIAAAMAILGVDEHRCLGLEDGTLADRAHAASVSVVAELIDEVAPDTIVTFGPEGMTGHPDHRAVAAWVADAWRRSGGHARLLHATTTARFAAEFADVHDAVPVFGPGLPRRTPDADVALAVRLDDELQDLKLAALRAQATQTHRLVAPIGEDRFRAWWREEAFTAAGRPAGPPPDLHDLTTSSPRSRRRVPSLSTTRQQPHQETIPMSTRHRSHDVVVVGSRVAGGATALLLSRMGHDVVVLDRALFPSDTLSTHAISRSGVVQLSRWGLLEPVLASGAPAIHQVTFHVAGDSTTRQVKDRAGVDHLVAPRRQVLDTIVADAAGASGADVRLGVTVTGVRHDGAGRVVGVSARDRSGDPLELDARFVVGADGLRSRIARSVGASVDEARPSEGSAHYAYYAGPAWQGIEFYVGEGSFAGVFPTNGGEACIWVCIPSGPAEVVRRRAASLPDAFDEMLAAAAPDLAARLRGAHRTSPVRGALRLPNQVRQAFGPGWALVGDAGYHRDPITGHGISDAFRDAELLAVALDRALQGEVYDTAALAGYQRRRDEALREIFDITCALATYPPLAEFVELQKRLSRAIEAEAAALAARPVPGEQQLAVA
jgi:flavin-dependent dehydrogenase/LmbE family N-acetylglucosaminyl deacetylase